MLAHNNGQWCRKIAGKIHSFGKWEDPTGALKEQNRLYANKKFGIPEESSFEGWRVGDLILEYVPKPRAVESLQPADPFPIIVLPVGIQSANTSVAEQPVGTAFWIGQPSVRKLDLQIFENQE